MRSHFISECIKLELESKPKPFPEKFIWEVINGKAIIYGNKRLVLIPSDAIDIQDFAIPQEWVDVPRLAGDYYLPIQVDLENRYLHIWGFVSRRTLKEKADYDPIYRTYYLEGDRVITNLDLLWAACQLCPDEKALGSQAFAKENYTEARRSFKASLNQKPNDPEARIYYNNARAADSRQKPLKIAVSVPIGSNPEVAQEILRGVALAHQEVIDDDEMLLQVAIAKDNNNNQLAAKVASHFHPNEKNFSVRSQQFWQAKTNLGEPQWLMIRLKLFLICIARNPGRAGKVLSALLHIYLARSKYILRPIS
jgi:tetratricopeptide (TPR) repeat protein